MKKLRTLFIIIYIAVLSILIMAFYQFNKEFDKVIETQKNNIIYYNAVETNDSIFIYQINKENGNLYVRKFKNITPQDKMFELDGYDKEINVGDKFLETSKIKLKGTEPYIEHKFIKVEKINKYDNTLHLVYYRDKNFDKIRFKNKSYPKNIFLWKLKNKILVMNENGGYFPLSKNDTNFQIKELETFLYSKNDIKIKKWLGGNHYYAKIGKIDVVDENGNVKWNTKEMAKQQAELYLKKLNEQLKQK